MGVLFRGRLVIEFNSCTKRYEVAYLKRKVRSQFSQQWQRILHLKSNSGVDPLAPARPPAPSPAALVDPPAPAKPPAPSPTKAPKREADPAGTGDEDDAQARKKRRKEMDKMLATAKSMKDRYTKALTTFKTIKHMAIETETDGWIFAKADLLKAQDVLSKVYSYQSRSPFWRDWFVLETSALKKHDNARAELLAMHGLEELVLAFDKKVKQIMAMKKAMDDVK